MGEHQLDVAAGIVGQPCGPAGVRAAQVLEGEREIVWSTFERIKDDERHAKVTLAEMREVEDRVFGNWWMGLVTRNEATEEAFGPYMVRGRLQPEKLSARKLLAMIIEVSKLGLSREIKNLNAA